MRRVVFSGDLGRRNLPLLRDPQLVAGCDVLITESTYGNKIHPPSSDIKAALLRIVTEAANNGGRVIIPAFSLGRTQQLLYFLNQLQAVGSLPEIPIFVDSPLSLRLTDIYRHHREGLDQDAQELLKIDTDLFDFPTLTHIESQRESAELNRRKGPFVVISASGMCENGRVRHHLLHAVPDARNTIVIIGFQAENTLGRRIVERQPTLKIFDRLLPLKAKVEILNGLSAHADAEDFKWWFEHMAANGGIGQAFLVHGEPKAATALAELMRDYCDEDAVIPGLYQSVEV
jgi:metallo-beta-lactamase family protein